MKNFSFKGNATRTDYWLVQLGFFLTFFALGFVFEGMDEQTWTLLFLVALVVSLWAVIATTVRRLRDAGIHFAWMLLLLIPYVGLGATLAFGIFPSKTEV